MTEGFQRLAEHDVHQGYVWRTVRAEFEAPDGQRFIRDFIRSPGAVAVLPTRTAADGVITVVLIVQWRASLERLMIEMPAGMRDIPGEPPIDTARRELMEEVGLVAERYELLTIVNPSAGLTDSSTYVYLATELTGVERELHGPEEAHSEVLEVTLSEATEMVLDGRITDAKTIIALLLLERRQGTR